MTKLLLSLLLISTISACSSVQSRIKEHEREFASLAPEAQAQIQGGRIDQGFTEDMVYMAKGKPDGKENITRDGKQILVWKYAQRDYSTHAEQAVTGLNAPYSYPTFGPGPAQQPLNMRPLRYLRVEFENGRVARWDPELQYDVPAGAADITGKDRKN